MTTTSVLANTLGRADNAAMLARLTKRTTVADRILELEFELPEAVDYTPGQFARIEVAPGEWRDYTIIDLHHRSVRFLVDARFGGSGSDFAAGIQPGDSVEMALPMGAFTMANNARHKVMVATGTGLAPFIAITLDAVRARRPLSMDIIFGCRDRQDDLAARYLPQRAASPRIDVTVCLSGENAAHGYRQGYVTKALAEHHHSPQQTEYYICGNPDMVADAVALLERRGAIHVFTEPY
jgi:ferredoxin-NADP reductase